MKSIFLAAVVICALAIAGVGGTFATWSDSEESMNNQIITGSVDLQVNGKDEGPYGVGLGQIIYIDCMVPCKWYGPYKVTLWNAGIHDNKIPAHAYIHFKNYCCGNALPKEGSGYAETGTGAMKPEPELVAEHGGKVDCVTVPGVGIQGDNCTMMSHVECKITSDRAGNNVLVSQQPMINLLCKEIYLFDLKPCNEKNIFLWFKLKQDNEEYFGYNFIKHPTELGLTPGTPEYNNAYLHWLKFNDWPSWGLMRDMLVFDVEFDLWLDCEGLGPSPTPPVVPVEVTGM